MSQRVAIASLGAGRMGRGIAVAFAYAGHAVTLVDFKPRDAASFAKLAAEATEEVRGTLTSLARLGLFAEDKVDRIVARCQRKGTMMVADSQSSSQIGDVSRFRGMRLLTPTEREARLAVRDFSSGLVVLGESLRKQAQARDVILTLGSEGVRAGAKRRLRSERHRHRSVACAQQPAERSLRRRRFDAHLRGDGTGGGRRYLAKHLPRVDRIGLPGGAHG